MKLIANARDWWRLWSIRLAAIGSALQSLFIAAPDVALSIWNVMPGEVKSLLPLRAVLLIPLGFFIAAMVARVVRQPKLEEAADAK